MSQQSVTSKNDQVKKNILMKPKKIKSRAAKQNCIVWAVDPYEKDLKPDKLSVDVLSSRFHGSLRKIIPVYVAQNATKNIIADIKEDTEGFLNKVARDQFRRPEVLTLSRSGKTENTQVKELLRFAKIKGAELIAVSSRGKRGLKRFLFGSFAEQLLKESKVPILFLTHEHSDDNLSQKVLFATDFSEESLAAYHEFLKFAKNFAYEIVLYHLVTDPYYNITSATEAMAGVPTYDIANYFADQMKWAEKEAVKWKKLTKKLIPKSEVKFILHESLATVAPSILKVAEKENVGFIGLNTTTNTFQKILFGSVSQEIFRAQTRPVWVAGPLFK